MCEYKCVWMQKEKSKTNWVSNKFSKQFETKRCVSWVQSVCRYLQWWKQLRHNAPCGEVFVWLHGTPQLPQSFVWLWPLAPTVSAAVPAFVAAFELSLSFVALAFIELVPAADDDDAAPAAVLAAVAADTDVAELVAVAFCETFAALSPTTFDALSLLFEFDVMFDVCWFEPFPLLPPPFWFGLAYSDFQINRTHIWFVCFVFFGKRMSVSFSELLIIFWYLWVFFDVCFDLCGNYCYENEIQCKIKRTLS